MTHPSVRLEEALRYWEDRFFLDQVLAQSDQLVYVDSTDRIPLTGPVKHYQDLRKHLLDLVTTERKRFSRDRFVVTEERTMQNYGAIGEYAAFLAAWTQDSRRVFHLSAELQALLSAMSFGEIKWGDVALPFDSFVISLERPLACGEEAYDAIVVSKHHPSVYAETGETLSIALISQKLEGYKALEDYDKRLWRNAMRQQKPNRYETYKRYKAHARAKLPLLISVLDASAIQERMASRPVSEAGTSARFDEGEQGGLLMSEGLPELVDDAFRLIAGLSLYLASLPPKSPHRSGWERPPNSGKPDPRAITNEAQVCEVTSVFELSPEEIDAFLADSTRRGKGKGPCAHFRRGHFRRKPGEGHDPTAPKVVLVKPALVRGDRLGPGELPGGGMTRI